MLVEINFHGIVGPSHNYAGLSVRASRLVYRLGRAVGLMPPESATPPSPIGVS